jgi:hypothetical protein
MNKCRLTDGMGSGKEDYDNSMTNLRVFGLARDRIQTAGDKIFGASQAAF